MSKLFIYSSFTAFFVKTKLESGLESIFAGLGLGLRLDLKGLGLGLGPETPGLRLGLGLGSFFLQVLFQVHL